MSDPRSVEPPAGIGSVPATSWTWPHPPLPNRWNASVTEVLDVAADGRRVAVIEGAIWPDVGSRITIHEDEEHVRRGTVSRVELDLDFRRPARILIWVELVQEGR